MNAVSTHSKLVHVVLTAILSEPWRNGCSSIKLFWSYNVSYTSDCLATDTKVGLRKRFSLRKLFNCGSFEGEDQLYMINSQMLPYPCWPRCSCMYNIFESTQLVQVQQAEKGSTLRLLLTLLSLFHLINCQPWMVYYQPVVTMKEPFDLPMCHTF